MSDEERACVECGMLTRPNEYHPFLACLAYRGCASSSMVRANLIPILAAEARARAEGRAEGAAEEREACARIASPTMDDILLHAGEMTPQERRTVTAVLTWIAAAIRGRK